MADTPKAGKKRRPATADDDSDDDANDSDYGPTSASKRQAGGSAKKGASGKGSTPRGKGGSAKKRRRAGADSDDDDDDDDGGSGSDGGSDDSDDDVFVFKYREDLFIDDQDRAELMAMPEVKRESILMARAEERDRAYDRWKLLREYRLKQKRDAQREKEAAAAAAKSERKRTSSAAEARSAKLEKLRIKRTQSAAKADETPSAAAKPARSRFTLFDSDSSDDDDEYTPTTVRTTETAVRGADGQAGAGDEAAKETAEMTFEQARRLQVFRSQLMSWHLLPSFYDTLVDCFVRINIGTRDNRPVYRVAQLVSLTDYHRTYHVGNEYTKKAVVLRIGNSKRTYRIEYVSNSPFDEKEYNSWVASMRQERLRLMSAEEARQKQDKLRALRSHRLTDAEIDMMLAERRKLDKNQRDLALERAELVRLLTIAQTENNAEEIARLTEELDKVRDLLNDAKSLGESELNRAAELNQRNRQKQKEAEELWAKQLANQEKKADDKLDVFARRRFKLSNAAKQQQPAPQPAPPAASDTANGTASEPAAKPSITALAMATSPKIPAAPLDALDGLDDLDVSALPAAKPIPVAAAPVAPSLLSRSLPTGVASPGLGGLGTGSPGGPTGAGVVRRTIDLTAYKKDRGIL